MVTRFATSLPTDSCPQRKGSLSTISRSDIRFTQHLDSRSWSVLLFIAYFPPTYITTLTHHTQVWRRGW
jgi:hypothetical protein